MSFDNFFKAVERVGSLTGLLQQRQEVLTKIRDVERKDCGNCQAWMTKNCKIEQNSKRKMSCSDSCSDCKWVDNGNLLPLFRKELAEIDDNISRLTSAD